MGNRVSNEEDTRTIIAGQISEGEDKTSNEIKTSKYSLLTFFPKNIMEQFRRIANFYFLIVTLISFIIDGPVSPMTSVAPLVFVISVTMIKQGYEDWLRHRTDAAVNNEPVTVIRNLTAQGIRCRNIKPGDFVKVYKDCDVPCDMILLWSADLKGKCYVNTANLDGETSLKCMKVPNVLRGTTLDKTFENQISMEVLKPEPDIYTFFGRIQIGGGEANPIGTESLLLRGSRVKNTEWVIGCAIYTGKDTKLVLNSKMTSNKFSSTESNINNFLIFFLILLTTEILISFGLKRTLERLRKEHLDYMADPDSKSTVASILNDILSFLLIYNYVIPISLYVTIELQKFIGSMALEWDNDLIDERTKQRLVTNSSDLNEELGQVEILFSDKTGTLTDNNMFFKMCSVNSRLYIENEKNIYELTDEWLAGENRESIEILNTDLNLFFTILALCHTVQVEEFTRTLSNGCVRTSDVAKLNKNDIFNNNRDSSYIPEYQSTSCDEIAFVKSAARRGIIFYGEEGTKLILKIPNGSVVEYEKLVVLEFTSTRKRMSVILKDPKGKLWMFTKGAETSVIPLCKSSPLNKETEDHANFFALQGLRTLAVAYKQITETELSEIKQEISKMHLNLHKNANSEDPPQWRKFEEGLTLLGATAVEDLLQENVAETLISLREAGIKIWVLTGDKIETAINVSQSCGHLPENASKLYLTKVTTTDDAVESLAMCYKTAISTTDKNRLTMVVDGQTLALILGKTDLERDFVEISLQCEAVLCCRLSPLQKAQIVSLIKKSKGKPITAAIGDGANDISMIQEAHVGFGIFGKEGRQAARAADFAFSRFMMIKKILLVHGHWFYNRLAKLIQYFFYKNLTFVNLMLFFQFHSQFSTQIMFYSVFLTCYNLFFTAAPIFFLSLTEQCHPKDLLMGKPDLYKKQTKNILLSWRNFFGWLCLAVYHSLVIFYVWYLTFRISPVLDNDGQALGIWSFGTAIGHTLIIAVNLKLFLMSRYQTYLFIATIILTILFYMGVTLLFSMADIRTDGEVNGTYTNLLGTPTFWFTNILILITMFLVDYAYLVIKQLFFKEKLSIKAIELVQITRL